MRNETAMEKRAASGTTYGGTNPAQTAAIRVLLGDNRSILANVISGRDSNATIVPHAAPPPVPSPPCKYHYKIKIFNRLRQLNDFTGKFETVKQMKDQILKEFKDELNTESADVGFFESCQASKIWLVSDKDLALLYQKAKKDSSIFLWIEPINEESDDDNHSGRKKRRKNKEDEIEDICQELKKKHGSDYTSPQLKLWARMLHCRTHDNYDDPPRVPMITGTLPKQPKKDSFTQVLTGAAEAVVQALSPRSISVHETTSSSGSSGISPGKSTELRMQNLQQLRLLQQLHDERILSDSELAEQKTECTA